MTNLAHFEMNSFIVRVGQIKVEPTALVCWIGATITITSEVTPFFTPRIDASSTDVVRVSFSTYMGDETA